MGITTLRLHHEEKVVSNPVKDRIKGKPDFEEAPKKKPKKRKPKAKTVKADKEETGNADKE